MLVHPVHVEAVAVGINQGELKRIKAAFVEYLKGAMGRRMGGR